MKKTILALSTILSTASCEYQPPVKAHPCVHDRAQEYTVSFDEFFEQAMKDNPCMHYQPHVPEENKPDYESLSA